MILKSLLRRKTRTLLTVIGIGIGVAAILALGVLSSLLENGYSSMMTGSKADLVLSQPNTFDANYSAVEEAIGPSIAAMPEVSEASGMLQGIVQTPENPFFFIFGYPEDSFILSRYQITEGDHLFPGGTGSLKGRPILLGFEAAKALKKSAGDSLRLGNSQYRIVGIFQTGDPFEDRGAVMDLQDAQNQLGRPDQVSLYYIQLEDPNSEISIDKRIARLWPDLSLSSTETFADKQSMAGILQAYVTGITGIAILLGGVGMMNAQLMSVIERTREIGVLRAVGWSSSRVLRMILGESIVVSFAGGILGILLGIVALLSLSLISPILAGLVDGIGMDHLGRAFLVVIVLGVLGGIYPAWRASRLPPVEALRYEGGTTGSDLRRLPVGGMAMQSLWQRSTRTLLTLGAIAITVGAIMALEGVIAGMASAMTEITSGSGAEIMVRQRDVTSSSLSSIDERIASRINSYPDVNHVSRMILTALTLPEDGGLFMLQGLSPNEEAIHRIQVVEGRSLASSREILLGQIMARALDKTTGDTIELAGTRFKVVGIFETGVSWEELGGVVSLRDAQAILGKPRQVTMLAVWVNDPNDASEIVSVINDSSSAARANLTSEFVEQLPDMQYTNLILGAISLLAIFVGGLAVLNTMLMAVMERTREIGLFRALGWRDRMVIELILREALLLGVIGGIIGIGVAFALTSLMQNLPAVGQAIDPIWSAEVFIRALLVALLLGLLGGLYPALRATRLLPTEALRYE